MNQFKYIVNQLFSLNRLINHSLVDPQLFISFNGSWIATIKQPEEKFFKDYDYENLMEEIQRYIFYLMEIHKISYTNLYEEMQLVYIKEKKRSNMKDCDYSDI